MHIAPDVQLTHVEMFSAAVHGVMRRMAALKRQRSDRNGRVTIEPWGSDIEGCAAEMLVAKWLGKFWWSLADRPSDLEGDVGKVQVRATAREDGALLLHEWDKDEAAFVLVVGVYPRHRIAGWILARDGKAPQFWRTDTGRPAFFVPQAQLHDPELLRHDELRKAIG